MPNTTSKAQFSRDCNVSKPAISKAVKNGSVILTADGQVDLDHRVTKEYISVQAAKKKEAKKSPPKAKPKKEPAKKAETKKKPAKKKQPPKIEFEEDEDGQLSIPLCDINSIARADILKLEKKDLEKLKIYEQTLLANMAVAKEDGTLIHRDVVRKVFLELYTVDTEQLKTMEDRLTPALCGIFGKQDDSEYGVKTRKMINDEMTKALDHIKRIIDTFLDSLIVES